ncbi:MAG TPA: hypothetical protein VGI66_00765 [Streptosporangiaceae bacterium]
MTISMQSLQDALVAVFVTVGIAVALSVAFVAVGAFVERNKARAAHAIHGSEAAQHPTQTDNARELVLR